VPQEKLTQQIRYCHTSDRVRLAYAWVGQGPPLVKAANWLSHLEYDWQSPVWRHWLEGLAQHHTLIRYDERGCGLSDWQIDDFSFEAWVDDLETVVEAAGLERFPLLGLSQGGPIAIAYAVRHPERVSHLILYGSYVRGRLKRNLTTQQLEEAQTFIQLIKLGWGQENPAFRQVFTTLFMPDATLEQQRWFNDLQRMSASPENAMRIVAGFNTIDVRNLASQVKAPTLVLHAKGDARIPFDEGELITSLIPSARFVSLESKNHILLEHEPAWQQFLTEVHQFLGVEAATPVQPRSASAASEPSAKLTHLAGGASEPRLAPALTPAGPRFVQEKLIAVGGMGQVYLGRDTETGQPVAIKRLKPELLAHHPEAVQRFLREGEILRQLNHPNIVKILALLEDEDQPMIVMEYVPDGSLKELLDQQTQLPLERVLNIGLELADALARVHHLDILHRDLKPANVLMAADGAPRLTDFGVAYLAQKESKLTQEGAILGTTAYLSPEAWRGEVLDARSDIWSFGAVLYEMLAGRPPFAADQAIAIMTAILHDPLPDLAQFRSDAPPALVTLIKHMLVKERELRLDSMRQVAAGLEVIYRDS
jgi:pimeloyl-ACP methyl ester carboxylesterase